MSITMAISKTNVVQFPIKSNVGSTSSSRGWSYLIAESVAFNKEVDFAIRIQKPDEEKVPQWITKLITGGQCSSIYVENLSLNAEEQATIERLCRQHKVGLFSLSVVQQGSPVIIQGPW